MSTTTRITLSPEARALLAAAPAWPAGMMRAIAATHDRQNELTIGHAQKTKMSQRGATTLGVVTNRLRKSLSRAPARIAGESVLSAIGTNVVYGGVHEFGFAGTVQVRAFTRRETRRDVWREGAVSTFSWKDGKITKRAAKPRATGVVRVRAHARKMRMPQRSFIGASLQERSADYGAALSRAVVASFRPQGGAA